MLTDMSFCFAGRSVSLHQGAGNGFQFVVCARETERRLMKRGDRSCRSLGEGSRVTHAQNMGWLFRVMVPYLGTKYFGMS